MQCVPAWVSFQPSIQELPATPTNLVPCINVFFCMILLPWLQVTEYSWKYHLNWDILILTLGNFQFKLKNSEPWAGQLNKDYINLKAINGPVSTPLDQEAENASLQRKEGGGKVKKVEKLKFREKDLLAFQYRTPVSWLSSIGLVRLNFISALDYISIFTIVIKIYIFYLFVLMKNFIYIIILSLCHNIFICMCVHES